MIFQERTYSVLIVSASEKMDSQLRALLQIGRASCRERVCSWV